MLQGCICGEGGGISMDILKILFKKRLNTYKHGSVFRISSCNFEVPPSHELVPQHFCCPGHRAMVRFWGGKTGGYKLPETNSEFNPEK